MFSAATFVIMLQEQQKINTVSLRQKGEERERTKKGHCWQMRKPERKREDVEGNTGGGEWVWNEQNCVAMSSKG